MTATDLTCGPIVEDWIRPPSATAAELVATLGAHDTESLMPWHAVLAAAADELHRDRICTESVPTDGTDLHWPDLHWTADDPIVALVRAVSLLARRHPSASSTAAGLVVGLLASGPDGQSSAS